MAGDNVAHYALREELGEGGLARVFLARDTKLNRDVALKVMAEGTQDGAMRSRFHLEARAIAALKHPNIVSVLDFSDAEADPPYIALEALEGRSMFDILDEHGPLQEQVAICIARDVAAALEHAHSQQIIHRDIKPDNAILTEGRVILIDFGAMGVLKSHETVPAPEAADRDHVVGTPGFMAPEQLTKKGIDERTDIFGLGALLYFMTTGAPPYMASKRDIPTILKAARSDRYEDPRSLQPLLTHAFCNFLADCLAPRSSGRISTATAARERLETLIDAHGIRDPSAVLAAFEKNPVVNPDHNLRTVSKLVSDLTVALHQDLQVAVLRENAKAIKKAIFRLQNYERFLDGIDQRFRYDRRTKPVFLRHRRKSRRLLWLMLGAWAGVSGTLLFLVMHPDIVMALRTLLMNLKT